MIKLNGQEIRLCDRCDTWGLASELCKCIKEEIGKDKRDKLKSITEGMRAKNEIAVLITPNFLDIAKNLRPNTQYHLFNQLSS